jgi:hypothetical protein
MFSLYKTQKPCQYLISIRSGSHYDLSSTTLLSLFCIFKFVRKGFQKKLSWAIVVSLVTFQNGFFFLKVCSGVFGQKKVPKKQGV